VSRNADSHYLVDNYFKDTLRADRLPFFPDSLAALVFSGDSAFDGGDCISWSMSQNSGTNTKKEQGERRIKD